MPYINLRDQNEGISMIQTVRKEFLGATKQEIEKSIHYRTVQRRIGHPPDERFKEIVSFDENGLHNLPVEVADIFNSNTIFGPNFPIIRGETARVTKIIRTKEKRFGIHRISTSYTRFSPL